MYLSFSAMLAVTLIWKASAITHIAVRSANNRFNFIINYLTFQKLQVCNNYNIYKIECQLNYYKFDTQ